MNVTKLEDDDFSQPLVNRVANSGLKTINLEQFLPTQKILALDVKDFLFHNLLLKEKEFRAKVKDFDWSTFENSVVAVHCSSDAIVQQWAYMLIVAHLSSAKDVFFGTKNEVETHLLLENIRNFSVEDFHDEKVIVKGCGHVPIPDDAYLEISKILTPVVKSLMFGEACSTVPVLKRK